MPTWNADQYLRFGNERTRACRDLAASIAVPSPRTVVDLGCGPGNSTEVLEGRWPDADLTGLDSSPDMIDAARRAFPDRAAPRRAWIVGDIGAWAARNTAPFDVVFSNAALQWVADHGALFPRLFGHVAPGGALAVQVPCNQDAPAHRLMRDLAVSAAWRRSFPAHGVREWHAHAATFYYDALASHAARVDIWETEYVHVLSGPEAIVDWYKGTGLRPFLEALASDAERARFVREYLERIETAFPRRPSGRVLFPFRRLFVVAYRAGG